MKIIVRTSRGPGGGIEGEGREWGRKRKEVEVEDRKNCE